MNSIPKYFAIILFLILSLCLKAQNVYEIKKTYFSGGAVETVGEYVNGVKHGFYKEYYEDGQLWKEWFFVNGKEEGVSNWYFPTAN